MARGAASRRGWLRPIRWSPSVVSSERVPARVRHSLNLESGLNDGLALPFVLVFIVLASPGGDAGTSALEAGESVAGAVIGVLVAFGAGQLLPRLRGGGPRERYDGVYALAVALVAFGLADGTIANGLVATFVAGIALGPTQEALPRAFLPALCSAR